MTPNPAIGSQGWHCADTNSLDCAKGNKKELSLLFSQWRDSVKFPVRASKCKSINAAFPFFGLRSCWDLLLGPSHSLHSFTWWADAEGHIESYRNHQIGAIVSKSLCNKIFVKLFKKAIIFVQASFIFFFFERILLNHNSKAVLLSFVNFQYFFFFITTFVSFRLFQWVSGF